jgi:hypothetical protein
MSSVAHHLAAFPEDVMEGLAVNGGYLAYAWLVLLQVSIVYLQRPDHYRRLRKGNAGVPEPYAVATGLVGTGLNWVSWLLSAYVAKQFGIASGVLFFCVGMAASTAANVLIPRIARVDRVGHFISIPVTILLARAVLRESGIDTGF